MAFFAAGVVLAVMAAAVVPAQPADAASAGGVVGVARDAASRIDAGGNSTCVIGDDDVLRCWGANGEGQLGDGTTEDRYSPVDVQLAGRPVAVSVGRFNACALVDDGSLWCWGSNGVGQIGIGNNGPPVLTPRMVTGLPGAVVDVSIGLDSVCAVVQGGDVWCWGSSAGRKLGQDADFGFQTVPVRVPDVADAVAVVVGVIRACALVASGAAVCWGNGGLPAPVAGLTNIAALGASRGGSENCAIIGSDRIVSCGSDGDSLNGLSNATSIASGLTAECATLTQGEVYCGGPSGDNVGLFEGGVDVGEDNVRARIPGISSAIAVTMGEAHACAVLVDGEVRCWGSNSFGQLTDSESSDSLLPTRVTIHPQVQLVAVGRDHTCIVVGQSPLDVWCAGANSAFQLADDRLQNGRSFESTLRSRDTDQFDAEFVSLDARGDQTCALNSAGALWCWGSGPVGDFTTPTGTYEEDNAVEVALGAQHQCMRRTGNTGYLECWGNNVAEQVGVSGLGPFADPQNVVIQSTLLSVERVDAGALHSCALGVLKSNEKSYAYCWGDPSNGATGPRNVAWSDYDPRWVRPAPNGDGTALDVATGSTHTCAISEFASVYCWGANDEGQLGQPAGELSAAPRRVDGLSLNARIYAGGHTTCVVDRDGAASCWGANNHGQLGNGTTVSTHVPQQVELPDAVRSMSVGPEHTCAVTVEDELYCWGDGDHGELGTLEFNPTPRNVAGVRVATGSQLCDGRTVTINMNSGASGVGTAGDDVILGTSGDDSIDGLGGNDTVCAGDGNDVVVGGDGADRLFGEGGRDVLRGNAGVDHVDGGDGDDRVLGGIDGDTLIGGTGDDYLGGFGGADMIFGGPGNETIFGGFGADTIDGGSGNDVISGLIGNDTINGGDGNDTLNGDRGNDTVNGGAGNDTINGGNGNDVLRGDAGLDTVNGGRADDQLSGGPGTNDTCVGNKQNNADTADATCELIFGVP